MAKEGMNVVKEAIKKTVEQGEIIDYYYNPNVECTCEAIFADTHRSYCKRRIRPQQKVREG